MCEIRQGSKIESLITSPTLLLLVKKMIEDILLYSGAAIATYLVATRVIRRFYKFPMPAFLGNLIDSNWRKNLQPPDKLIKRSGIKNGMTIMELGCGAGTYTIDAARVIGGSGILYAIDIQQEMINKLENKLKKPENKDINNIETKMASAYELPFKNNFFDLVYMVTVLPEIPDKQKALKEIYRVLKNDGILAVSEFLPDPDYPLRKTTQKWCEQAGFRLVKSSGSFFNYTLRFKKR